MCVLKLLLYSHGFAPQVGGVESIVFSLAQGLSELRTSDGGKEFDVTLVTQTPAEDFDDRALTFSVVRKPGLAALARLIRAADLVHVAGPALVPLIMGWLARKPVALEHHGFQTVCPNGQLFIERNAEPCPGHFMAGRHASCIHCNWKMGPIASFKLWVLTFLRRFLSARVSANIMPTTWLGQLLHLPRSVPIAHGIEAASQRKGSAARRVVIAFQARLVSTKGLRILLEAARILIEQNRIFEVLIIGDGPERASASQLVAQAGLSSRVRFAGRVPDSELDAAFANATMVIVPSLGGEVFGLAVVENMSRALPVVASDLGAFVEVIGDAGLTFRTGDAKDLAEKITTLLDQPDVGVELGRRARERVTRLYDKGRMIEAHARVYLDIAAAGQR